MAMVNGKKLLEFDFNNLNQSSEKGFLLIKIYRIIKIIYGERIKVKL